MGKKAKLKQIRRIASSMPAIEIQRVVGERVQATDLLLKGITEVQGKPVTNDQTFIEKKVASVPFNRNRRMKKLYNKYGRVGVSAYIQSVKNYVITQNEKQNSLK